MSQELEYEAKSLLNATDFTKLINDLKLLDEKKVQQHNHYFETSDFSFRSMGSALRIREKNESFTLTLKQPAENGGLLETHQKLSKEEMNLALSQGTLPSGKVYHQLEGLGLAEKTIRFLGTLTTERIEKPFADGAVFLDKSSYLQAVDYEIEFEGHSLDYAEKTLKQLLEDKGIPQQETANKVARFFARKAEIEGE
ncbi:CYTH domain-containing protein [Alkalicoccobacillus porphyridii]|uniref:CYTH domain-containing protein n=1 Tax=Alkalicoccobacillus porphyridii TaxID=2597270 RepID=A0A553ZXB8_9BACI|nr:CYTH domain-containing protein [Alkalicoccobacillus porphyridii]TSB46098.1 CYTH domain-containing protein [Alkalicoccobacillus porphyridii]